MDRKEQIKYCEQCLNKSFDSQRGMICGLNGLVPDIKDSCPNKSTNHQSKWLNLLDKIKLEVNKFDSVKTRILSGVVFLITGLSLLSASIVTDNYDESFILYILLIGYGIGRLFA